MEERNWIRLDNASNIFVAARNDTDTKVFRLTAEMTESIHPVLLQEALENTYNEYPLFHNVLRRGFFWYYLQTIDTIPKVRLETDPPCSPIYHYDKHEFLFRVLYREQQIHLEVFHALTDGTGALWFFEDLLTEYVRLRYATEENHMHHKNKREKKDLEDSFNRYFRKKQHEINVDVSSDPLEKIEKNTKKRKQNLFKSLFNRLTKKVYQVKGERTPDHRLRIIKLNLPVDKMLELARSEGVSLTIYMTALYILSVYQAKENKAEDTTISVSIPINLRQFFPSISVRNFFSTTTVSYRFKEGELADLSKICQELDEQFKEQLEKDAIEQRLEQFINFEYNPLIRIVLRPVKDLLLKTINKLNNRGITLAMSNLGIVNLPEEMADYMNNFYFYTSVIRPQFCMVSYGNQLNISFTSPFTETIIYQNFVRYLSNRDIDVVVDSNKVTREEMTTE